MKKYLIRIRHYFSGYHTFEIAAGSKSEALSNARALVDTDPFYSGGNYDRNSIECLRKIKN